MEKAMRTVSKMQSLTHLVLDINGLSCPTDCYSAIHSLCEIVANIPFQSSLIVGVKGQVENGMNEAVADAFIWHNPPIRTFYDAGLLLMKVIPGVW